MAIDWKWLTWNVFIPLIAPILISGIVILAWSTGNSATFEPNLSVIIDVSPWAMTFYSLALISSTLNLMWDKLSVHSGMSIALILAAAAILLYASFIVIWRHNPEFVPGIPVYSVTIILLLASIYLGHSGYLKMRNQ